MRNLHQIILQEYGLEVLPLFRDWERLQLRASNYKNHRIFTLRCIHKDLVLVSIKLKTTIKTEKARKIIKIAERNLLQARIKYLNGILDTIAKQTEICRSKIVSILSTAMFSKHQDFIEKVGEIRFIKVKNRQVNKFNNLIRKEGNVTGLASNFSQADRHPPGQHGFPGSQCSPPHSTPSQGSPSQEGDSLVSQAGSQAGTSQAGHSLVSSQADRQTNASLPRDSTTSQESSTSQVGRLVPPSWGQCYFPGS